MIKRTIIILGICMAVIHASAYDTDKTNRSKIQKNGNQYVESNNKDQEKVYYCEGSSAYAFHLYRDCSGLNHCNSEIATMTQKEALGMKKKRCKNCWNRLQREK